MPLVLRPRQQGELSDPLYAATAYPPAGQLPRVPWWLRVLWVCAVAGVALGFAPGSVGDLFSVAGWVLLAVAVAASVPTIYKSVSHTLLWRLRNRLLLTYLLVGLAPVVLFFTLVFLFAYVAAGQFAIHLASQHLQLQLDSMGTSDAGLAFALARRVEAGGSAADLAQRPDDTRQPDQRPRDGRQRAVYLDDQSVDLPGIAGNARSPLRLTRWIGDRRSGQIKVFAEDGGMLYMAVVDRVAAGKDHEVTVIGAMPVTEPLLMRVAAGLGQVTLLPGVVVETAAARVTENLNRGRISGGDRPRAANLFDYQVVFRSRLPVLNWESGDLRPVPLVVTSRPSVLFEQLFGPGLTSSITEDVRLAFTAVCIVFAVLEISALYLAMRLTRTMTRSVEDLYGATVAIDSGNLTHRIRVTQEDQLGDLGRSFNRMSWSLSRLIDEQKEKERMQSELSIAQEVQANLFPRASVRLPALELHGICRPARTVSGDYYDFLEFRDDPNQLESVTGMGLALGDISGKGISAALLMATLHAAVRAYRFASEEMFSGEARGLTLSESLECGALFESPARILSLLNRHLYRSTQPEKYATLFLAHYDARSARLTYSNGGQLPPFLMRSDGSVRALDQGGTVVGLMDGMRYDQETIQMEPGDLMIAYSDGVTEPENDFGEFGEDRLLEVIRQFRGHPLEVISAEVMAALDAWIGGAEQPDDITLVLARQM